MNLTHAERRLLHITLKIIGKNIQNARMHRKCTLKKLARNAGLKIETLDRYELGQTTLQIPELMKISTALDIRLEKLMEYS